jgi:TPR repeat protein
MQPLIGCSDLWQTRVMSAPKVRLGLYAKGQGVPRNDAEAVKWYRLAADQGNAEAQLSLARMYETGRGVPQSDTDAATWYRRAADQGEPWAQTNLGVKYARGQGVSQDYVTAYMWLVLSAAQGDRVAVQDMHAAAQYMTPAQIAEAQKRAAEWKPKKEESRPVGVH